MALHNLNNQKLTKKFSNTAFRLCKQYLAVSARFKQLKEIIIIVKPGNKEIKAEIEKPSATQKACV